MLTKVLQALRLEQKAQHADKIEKAFHEELDKHKPCGHCLRHAVAQ